MVSAVDALTNSMNYSAPEELFEEITFIQWIEKIIYKSSALGHTFVGLKATAWFFDDQNDCRLAILYLVRQGYSISCVESYIKIDWGTPNPIDNNVSHNDIEALAVSIWAACQASMSLPDNI